MKEAEERARGFLEAQGDLIVRRDASGHITYANDAYGALAGVARDELIGRMHQFEILEQGEIATLPDGTRVHDQKIASPVGARWIAWRDVALCASAARPKSRASAATSPTACNAEHALERRARPGGRRQPRQVALPRDGQPRDPHAAQRHSRHGGPAARHAAHAGADHLRQGRENLRRDAALADRGDSRFLQDRSRPARSRSAAIRSARHDRGNGRAARAARAGQGPRDRVLCRRPRARARHRRRHPAASGAAQSRRQRHQVHRPRRRRHRGRARHLAGRNHFQGARHRHRHRRPRSKRKSFWNSSRARRARQAAPAAPGWALRSRAASSSAWADDPARKRAGHRGAVRIHRRACGCRRQRSRAHHPRPISRARMC